MVKNGIVSHLQGPNEQFATDLIVSLLGKSLGNRLIHCASSILTSKVYVTFKLFLKRTAQEVPFKLFFVVECSFKGKT